MENILHQILSEIKEIKNDIAHLKDDVSVLKDDVSVLKGDVLVLQGDVTGIKKDMEALRQEVQEVKERLIFIENDHGRSLVVLSDGYKMLFESAKVIRGDLGKILAWQEAQDFYIKMLEAKSGHPLKQPIAETAQSFAAN